jgi:hypothetical protein
MGESSEKSFAVVKDYLIQNFPEFQTVRLKVCSEADKYYEESISEQVEEGKLPRVFSHTVHEDNTVCYTEKMDELSEEQRTGIFIHEFGHLYIENHPFDFVDEERPGEVENDDINADIVVYEMFKVEIHYDDNDIEFVNLPLGCDIIEELDEDDDEESEGEIEGEEEETGRENGGIINHPDNISELLTDAFPKKEPDLPVEEDDDLVVDRNDEDRKMDKENREEKNEGLKDGKTNMENIQEGEEGKLPNKSDTIGDKETKQKEDGPKES